MMRLKSKINHYWYGWVRKRALSVNPHQFDSGNLYIFPSSFGWAFALVLLTLFLCAINYQVSAVFFLTFLLAVAGMVSAWQAHFNLKGLTVNCVSIDDTYQGGAIKIVLSVISERKLCYALDYHVVAQEAQKLEILSSEGTQLVLYLPANHRGCFQLPRITFYSYFPLGLFRVWGYIYFDNEYFVYPSSVSPGFWPKGGIDSGDSPAKSPGNEEIYDVIPATSPWAQPSRIAWKIAARGQGWYLKTMVSSEGHYWLFRIQDLPSTDLELNLQHLSYWLQTAEQGGYLYGLELNKTKIDFAQGPAHLTHCLRQLAIY